MSALSTAVGLCPFNPSDQFALGSAQSIYPTEAKKSRGAGRRNKRHNLLRSGLAIADVGKFAATRTIPISSTAA